MTEPAAMPAPPPRLAGDTTRENPWPVRSLSQRMVEYIGKAPAAWVEGQIAELSVRPGQSTAYLTLRDPAVDMSLKLTCSRGLIDDQATAAKVGSRIVVHGKFDYWAARGTLSFRVDALHPVGIGELLARLERVRALLAAEGLTADSRKKPLPFLPRGIGLITSRDSAAETDFLTHARLRWPAVTVRVAHSLVQGNQAVGQLIEAVKNLDADPGVDVIVFARGGGSVEDLLPFSDELLCRTVAACRTPVVSAVGHEPDHPILDDVADLRCSTPTDAGKRIVPDVAAELAGIDGLRRRSRRALAGWVERERLRLDRIASATVLARPLVPIAERRAVIDRLSDRARTMITGRLTSAGRDLDHRRAQLAALGPNATLARGYAVVQAAGALLVSPDQAPPGTGLRIRVRDGVLHATSTGPETDLNRPLPKEQR